MACRPPASTQSSKHHAPVRRSAHWLSAAAVLGALALAVGREWVESDVLREALLPWHRQLGLLALGLLLVRLVARLRWPDPPVPAGHRWATRLATGMHLLLYLLLLAVPLLGWAMSNAQGHVLNWLGWLRLPILWPVDPDWADRAQEWHAWAAWTLVTLAALHLLAALWHHFVSQDETLSRMWPALSRSANQLPHAVSHPPTGRSDDVQPPTS